MAFEMKNMAYWKAKNNISPAKQKVDPDAPGPPGTPGYEPEVTPMDYLRKKPSIVASKSAKKNYDDYGKVVSDKETKRINTTPNTTPPMFSGAKAHNIAANITEGSIESQNLRRKENEKKKN